jgi:hypothetical protein
VVSLAEHLPKIPSIAIFGIFQCENQIRLLDQIRTQQTPKIENAVYVHRMKWKSSKVLRNVVYVHRMKWKSSKVQRACHRRNSR